MKLFGKSAVLFLLVAVMLFLGTAQAFAESSTESFPDVSKASSVYFYHVESGRCMGAKNESAVLPAGTMVRMLSGLIFCEELADRQNDWIVIDASVTRDTQGYYRFGLEDGESYTVEQLLYLSICGGYNDAFYALAYELGDGSVQSFVERMNRRAEELGAMDTTVMDPSGITDTSVTTALDLLSVAKVTMENALYMKISSSVFYDMNGSRRIENRNALISSAQENGRYQNSLCRGLSAGNTQRGGWSVVTLSQKGNDRYLCIVLGGEEGEGERPEKYGYVIANRLIQWGYANYSYLEVLTPETVICSIPVEISDLVSEVQVKPAESMSFYLPAGVSVGEEIQLNVRLMYESLEAPVAVGTHVGYVAVIYQGEILGTVAIYTAEEAPRGSFIGGLKRIQGLTEDRAVRAGLIFFVIALIGWILTEYLMKRARHHKWDRYFSEKIDTSETFLK